MSSIYQSIINISNTLIDAKIIHRDIKPNNILVTPDSNVVLIDYQFCIKLSNPKEMRFFKKNPQLIKELGDDFARDKYSWDDHYSLLKVLDFIKDGHFHTENEIKSYKNAYCKIEKNVNKVSLLYRQVWFKYIRVMSIKN